MRELPLPLSGPRRLRRGTPTPGARCRSRAIIVDANAVKRGSAYLVNYQTYCLIETGPDKGKDHACFEFNATLSAGELRSAVADFKRRLGR